MAGWLRRLTGRGRLDVADYPDGPIRQIATQLPSIDAPLSDVELVALDLETTGLDSGRDSILSIGWVPMVDGQIRLAEARHVVVRPPAGTEVGDSATFHGLTDDQVASAPALPDVLPEVLDVLRGRVLVAHHARMEVGFLGRVVQATWETSLPLVTVDTLQVQQRLVTDAHGDVRPGVLRLDACRQHFGLPRYRSHLALTDAIATAELLLAQSAHLEYRRGRALTLADLGARLTR